MCPLPVEQFEHLHDYSNLSGLHIYGGLLDELYNLDVEAPLATAGQLYEDVKLIDRALFTVYVVFALSKVGYDLKLLASESNVPHLTTKFDITDWTSLCEFYQDHFAETLESPYWSEDFVSKDRVVKVVFLDFFFTDNISELKQLFALSSRDLAVVHPRTARHVKGVFLRLKNEFMERKDEGELISTGELLPAFVPEETRRKIIDDEWQAILDDILANLIRTWPIIGIQQNRKMLEDSKEYIRLSRAKYEMGQMMDSMRDACLACEGLLTVMTKIYEPRKLEDRPVLSDLIENLRQHILAEFGEDVQKDLDFVREWRNRVSHVGRESPTPSDVLKVLTKVELFMSLFERQIRLRSLRKGAPGRSE